MKDYQKFFLVILLPNIMRQALYYATFLKTNSTNFIDSFETAKIYTTIPFLGVLEEIIIGLVITLFWFKFSKLKFLAYGWITDALIDYIFVISWFFIGLTPLQLIGLGSVSRFFIREIALSYLVLGVLLYKYKINIYKLALSYSAISLLALGIILF